jgi:two-component system chemotaxis response regulator CheB
MTPVRILVVDDSVVIRKLLTTTLGEVPGLEVVATAAQGKIALAKLPQCRPDVVILDVEMPEMDGIETLKRIRKDAPQLPVIMFSTRTERGAAATIEALTCGASDYVAKPSHAGSAALAMARVREEMVPKILALTAGRHRDGVRPPGAYPPIGPRPAGPATTTKVLPIAPAIRPVTTASVPILTGPVPAAPIPSAPRARLTGSPDASAMRSRAPASLDARTASTTATPVLLEDGPIRLGRPAAQRAPEIVAIGASTGGPNALSVLLTQLPADFPVPIVIVQHMLAAFTRHFAERLASQSQIKIVEASAGEALVPGCAYIARGDHHLVVERRMGRAYLAMNQDEVENFCRPAVDVLFRSVAQSYGPGALAVVLTGMGHDGLLGCGAIRDAGGDVIVQDEATSVVWGMPGYVARAGLASQVMALGELSGEVRRRVALGAVRRWT